MPLSEFDKNNIVTVRSNFWTRDMSDEEWHEYMVRAYNDLADRYEQALAGEGRYLVPLSEYDKKNIDAIMDGHGDWFTAQLLRLCQKADSQHLMRLSVGFPAEVEAYMDWRDREEE